MTALDGGFDGEWMLAGVLEGTRPSHWQGDCREEKRAIIWQENWQGGVLFGTDVGGVLLLDWGRCVLVQAMAR